MDDAPDHIVVNKGVRILHHQQYHEEKEADGGVDLFPIPMVVVVVHIGEADIVRYQ